MKDFAYLLEHLSACRPNPPVHHHNSAIEFILLHLALKPLRVRQPSVNLLLLFKQAFLAQRRACPELAKGISASRAARFVRRTNRVFGSLHYLIVATACRIPRGLATNKVQKQFSKESKFCPQPRKIAFYLPPNP